MEFGFNEGNNGSIDPKDDKTTNINGGEPVAPPDINEPNNEPAEPNTQPNSEPANEPANEPNNNKLEAGTKIEVENKTYTIDDNGNVVDDKGEIFKHANEVDEWIKSFDNITGNDESDEININTIQKALDIEFTDDNGNPVEFDNTSEGVLSYINNVLESKKDEYYETAINTLYQKYPIIKDVLNYYVANGNSLDGFNEMPDRSFIVIDDTNEAQQESIIEMAWKEKGIKGDIKGYIDYLKNSGTLLSTAKDELESLQQIDEENREMMEQEAEAIEKQNYENELAYWNGVKEVIDTRNIAGYKIPDNIIINRDGKKIAVTPNDFFNYLYRVDSEGKSMYEKDLEQENPIARRDDEILRAYLKFVGGNYSNLVDMAINDKQINVLKLKAKQNKTNARIIKPSTKKQTDINIDFGY